MTDKIKRIIFIANTRLRYTNILKSILLSLLEMGHYVKEIDTTQNPGITSNPYQYQGGHGPVEIKYREIEQEIESFKADIIIFAGGGLTFSEKVSTYLKNKGIIILGITLSDPDVFSTVKDYVGRFSYHTTNSKYALEKYRELGYTNTHYLPFGVDSRFFVPTPGISKYETDVIIIGHFRDYRLFLAEQLRQKFNTRIYGNNWPYENIKSVEYPEILKVIHSGKIIIDFPRTGAGFQNVKIRLFEVAATGKLIITEKLDIIEDFFQFGKEIIGYVNYEELYEKIDYYLKHPDERKSIGKNAQLKCARNHLWKNRLQDLFSKISL